MSPIKKYKLRKLIDRVYNILVDDDVDVSKVYEYNPHGLYDIHLKDVSNDNMLIRVVLLNNTELLKSFESRSDEYDDFIKNSTKNRYTPYIMSSDMIMYHVTINYSSDKFRYMIHDIMSIE